MSTLTTYRTALTHKLGTSSESFYTSEMRDAAINEALGDVIDSYDVPSLIKKATLTLTSAFGTIPTDFQRMIKVWDVTTSSIEYIYATEDQMDPLDATASYYWGITDDAGTRKIKVYPNAKTSVYIRYIRKTYPLSSGSDESGLSDRWDDAIAYRAASALLFVAKDYNNAQANKKAFEEEAAKAYNLEGNIGGVKSGSRVRSIYEKRNMLN